jgi:uncharacterized protein (TIGR03435 family)
MRSAISPLVVIIVGGVMAFGAQSPPGSVDRPKFDVVSIKVNKTPGVGVGRINLAQAGGHVTASNVSLKFLMIAGYQFADLHFAPDPKGAEWIESEHFDIEAEVEGNPTVEQKRLMIQSMLADRFKLVMHDETQQRPEFALEMSKPGKLGTQLKSHSEETKCVEVPAGRGLPPIVLGAPLVAPCAGFRVLGSDLVGQNVTMEQLARTLRLSFPENPEIVDRTGLSGTYDVTLHFQVVALEPEAGVSDPSVPPSIFTALQQQLGLRLESTKGPVNVTVIDHVEQPSQN